LIDKHFEKSADGYVLWCSFMIIELHKGKGMYILESENAYGIVNDINLCGFG